jgi:HlyD family secretion protein
VWEVEDPIYSALLQIQLDIDNMKKVQTIIQALILLVIGVVVVAAAVAIIATSKGINGESAQKDVFQGIVAAKDVSINTKIPGRIEVVNVSEGQNVKAGDVILEISSDELQAKEQQLLAVVEQAKAGVEASTSQRDMAKAVSEMAENGARNQQVVQAESVYTLWSSTYNRAKVLYDGGAISLQKLEEIRTQKEVYAQTLDMAIEGARIEQKDAANAQLAMAEAGLVASKAKLDQAEAGLGEVRVYLEDTVIKSSIDGVMTSINVDEGELVSTGMSLATVSNLDTCWVTVNVDEDEISEIMEGQEAKVELLAFKDKEFIGKVATVNKQPDFAVKKSTSENGNFDIVSFGVKIEIENNDEFFRPGMTAVVDFLGQEVTE